MKFLLLCVSVSLWWTLPLAGQGKNETIFHRHESTPPAEAHKPLGQPGTPDAGDIRGDVYTNQFFGFSYTLPESLTTVTDIMQGEQDLAGRASVLLSLEGEAPEGKPPEALVIAADKLAPAQAGANAAAEYVKQVDAIAAKQGAEALGTREMIVGGQKFVRADFRRGQPVPGFQASVVGVRRGYVLIFNFAAETQVEMNKLVGSLGTVKFSSARP